MKIFIFLTVGLLAFGSLQPGFAQVPGEGMAMKIAQAEKSNAALTRQYTWNSRTELIDQGVLKDTRIEEVVYGPDGQCEK
jgi:hypothetical protein